MKYPILLICLASILLCSCAKKEKNEIVDRNNLHAWCIVPFDNQKRSPDQRIKMLKELNIKKYAYDWRDENLPQMAEELQLAKENDIEVIAVWMWINAKSNDLGKLNESNERVFKIIEEEGYQGQIWLGFNSNFFENLSDSAAVSKGAEMISYLSKRASKLNCKIALYNHGDWFGEPENQVKIIKALPGENLGIVYNFHHGHHQIENFSQIAQTMLPYLWTVNLNGMKKGGPKILTIGKGDHEKEMIQILLNKGYQGDFGILGHVDEADVKTILEANLEGLSAL